MPEESLATQDTVARDLLLDMIAEEPHRLRRRSISRGVPIDDADDVAQTALLRAWRSIAHLEAPEPGRMCSWLDAIARNAAIDLARRRARRPEADLGEETPDETSVEAAVEIRVLLDGALAALHALPDALREPLVMMVVDGMSAAQIGERLGIDPAAVRQRVARARKALQECRHSGMGTD